jgi:hypothetical protein
VQCAWFELPWRWTQQALPKHPELFTNRYGVISNATWIFKTQHNQAIKFEPYSDEFQPLTFSPVGCTRWATRGLRKFIVSRRSTLAGFSADHRWRSRTLKEWDENKKNDAGLNLCTSSIECRWLLFWRRDVTLAPPRFCHGLEVLSRLSESLRERPYRRCFVKSCDSRVLAVRPLQQTQRRWNTRTILYRCNILSLTLLQKCQLCDSCSAQRWDFFL